MLSEGAALHFTKADRFSISAPELTKALRSVHREPAGAETHHHLFAIDDLERQVGSYLHHDHVDRVRPDVDRGDPHVSNIIGVSAVPK